jgi:hypothetical protein
MTNDSCLIITAFSLFRERKTSWNTFGGVSFRHFLGGNAFSLESQLPSNQNQQINLKLWVASHE